MTLEKTTINIGKTEQQGLTFTAISWVKSLDGLQFKPPFSYDRHDKMEKCAGVSNRKVEEDKLRSITMYLHVIKYLYHITLLLFTWTLLLCTYSSF